MASRREIVMFTGHLKGMGREIECSVTLVKVSLPGTTKEPLKSYADHNCRG